MHLQPATKLYIDDSTIEGAGRGVFAGAACVEGEMLEECHYVVLSETNYKAIEPVLQDYLFALPPDNKSVIVLGFAMAFNHSLTPNVSWEIDWEEAVFRFHAVRDLVEGEELFINYRQSVPYPPA